MLQSIDKKAADLGLSFKPVKCVSYLFDGLKIIPQGISLSKGATRSIVEGETKFLGKIIDVSIMHLSMLSPTSPLPDVVGEMVGI